MILGETVMAPRKGNLMSVRNDIKVVDATLRDGGLCNNFEFTDEFARELYKTNIKSGIDYMEFGYKASRNLFNEKEFGKWKFCKEEDLRAIVGDNISDMKIAVMADVGRCDFKTDFLPKSESVIDMVRVACYIHQIPAAIEMIEYCHDLGYETTCNIMAISQSNLNQVEEALEMLCASSVDVIYLVDSYGSLYPENAAELAKIYLAAGEKSGKQIGFHAHNNQNLAFANTIETLSYGVSYLDATAQGIGRGAGNCAMELLLGFLKNPKYSLYSLLTFIEKYMIPLREEGVVWGYDLQYMFTGQLNRHPREAMEFTAENRKDYCEFYKSLLDNF
jgi:4-hydroxy 2-oxovalerate aldolase